jgi:beta-1,4-N-acetylgalactosaminyltransferase 2
MVDDKVTIIIKTFERPKMLKRMVASIKLYYPNITILVGDDSENPTKIDGVDFFKLPFDVGVSAGRNFLIDKVKTKYFVTVDDDLQFNEKTKLENFLDIIEHNDIDVLCGGLTTKVPNQCSNLELNDGVITVKPIIPYSKRRFVYCDYGVQFFIANTEKFKEFGGWDEELKTRGEHIELFLRAKGKLKVAFTPEVVIWHERGIHGSDKYKKFRTRDHLALGMKKHGVVKIINYNGKEKDIV